MNRSKAKLKYDWNKRRVYVNVKAYAGFRPPRHDEIADQMNRRIQENEWKWDSFQEWLK